MDWAREMSRDGWLLFAATGLRNLAFGFLAVVLAAYLDARGLSVAAIGAIFTAALVGGAAMTVLLAGSADRLGRRHVLVWSALLMAAGAAGFASAQSPLVLMAAAVVGTISPSGREVGPFLSVEQAILPQAGADRRRTDLFAAYNLVGALCGALGALIAGVPDALGLGVEAGGRALLWACVGIGLAQAAFYALMSPAAEAPPSARAHARVWLSVRRSRAIAFGLAALFAVDSFAGGFVVQGLMAYWFHVRWGLDTGELAWVFFGVNLLSALSFLAAAPLARRIGLLNTMVFTHLPSNVLLILVPLMPSASLAVLALLGRHLLSQLDTPTRQSYTMAVVHPDERAAVAGLHSVVRNTSSAIAPAIAGLTLASPALGTPFLISGLLKIAYDLALLLAFRHVRPPEELDRRAPPGGPAPRHARRR